MSAFSSSTEEIHSPPDLITSLVRSMSLMNAVASSSATSPVRSQPSSVNFSRAARVVVVVARDPRAAHLELAARRPRRCGTRPAAGSRPWHGAQRVAPRPLRARPPAGRREVAASGLVSVIPQPWTIGTPKRSSKARIRRLGHGRAARHQLPQAGEVGRRIELEEAVPDRRHAGAPGDALGGDQLGQRLRGEVGPGHHLARAQPSRRRTGGPTPSRGTSARRASPSRASRMPIASGSVDAEGVQDDRAVRVEHALGLPVVPLV